MKNRLVVVGFLSSCRCYLNVPREEAIRRYREHHKRMLVSDRAAGFEVKDANYDKEEGDGFAVTELEFDDEFLACDIEEAWTYNEAGEMTPP